MQLKILKCLFGTSVEPIIHSDWFFSHISCYFLQLGHSYLASETIFIDLLKGTQLEVDVRGNCYFGGNVCLVR